MRLAIRRAGAATLVAVSGLFAGLALASCGGQESGPATETTIETTQTTTDTTPTVTTTETAPSREPPTTVRVTVRGGAPAGGIVRARIERDDRVVLLVRSDVADEVHVHGYDLLADVAPGRTARIAFRATVPGRFDVELERRHVPIAVLTVR